MSEVLVAPLGSVEDIWLDTATTFITGTLELSFTVLEQIPIPENSYDSKRRQYLATALLERLLPIGSERAARVLGITEVDLFIPVLTFMFGQAQLGGRLALVSLARLRPEFYGLPADSGLTTLRLRKEIRHEIGHTLGLVHCSDKGCAMSLSNSIAQADAKHDAFCSSCQEMCAARLRRLRSGEKK